MPPIVRYSLTTQLTIPLSKQLQKQIRGFNEDTWRTPNRQTHHQLFFSHIFDQYHGRCSFCLWCSTALPHKSCELTVEEKHHLHHHITDCNVWEGWQQRIQFTPSHLAQWMLFSPHNYIVSFDKTEMVFLQLQHDQLGKDVVTDRRVYVFVPN